MSTSAAFPPGREVEPPVAAPRGAYHQMACHFPLPVPEEAAAQPV